MGISISDLDNFTIGMIYDLLEEKLIDSAEDEESNVQLKETKEDFQEKLDLFLPIS